MSNAAKNEVLSSFRETINNSLAEMDHRKLKRLFTPTSSPGSSRFSIWRRLGRRPWHTADHVESSTSPLPLWAYLRHLATCIFLARGVGNLMQRSCMYHSVSSTIILSVVYYPVSCALLGHLCNLSVSCKLQLEVVHHLVSCAFFCQFCVIQWVA